MEVRVLGSLEVVDGVGDAVPLASTAQRRLTAMLVAHDGSVVSSDRLCHELGISKGGLQTAVSRLRKSLGAEYLLTESPGYALRGVTVDAAAFDDEVGRASSAEPHRRAEILDRALRRWRNDAYLEFADEEWARGPAARLTERRATATEERAEALITIGAFADAVALLVEHIDRYPLRDHPRGLLMRSLAAQGRQSEALRAYRSYRTYLGETVGTEPSTELQALERKIVGGWHDVPDAPLAGGASTERRGSIRDINHNLRPHHDGFIDRPEVAEVVDLIGSHRLVTVVGPGGFGKSRLAEAVGLHVVQHAVGAGADRWRDGVWFVDLAPLRSDDGEAVQAVARSLGLTRRPEFTVSDTVVEFLRDRDALLILDNCEHVLDEVRPLVERLFAAADAVDVLASSRVRLGLAAERTLVLEPMADDVALQLFEARVAEIGAGPFPADDSARLCAMLDHYPLAIELAAGRCQALTAAELCERLGDHPEVLRARSGAGDQRHASVTVALDWSIAQLEPGTRTVLERAVVISGGFDLEAAEGIVAFGDVSRREVLDHLEELVEHNLVHRDHRRGRFRILEPIRQTVAGVAPPTDELAARHAAYYVSLMERIAEGLVSPDEPRWLARLHDDLPNVRIAVARAIEHEAWPMLERMMRRMPLAIEHHTFIDGADWAERILATPGVDPTHAPATALTAAAGRHQMERFDECDALLGKLEADDVEPSMLPTFCFVRGTQQLNEGSRSTGMEWMQRCVDAARQEDDAVLLAVGSRRIDDADALGNPTIQVFARVFAYMVMDPQDRAHARPLMEEAHALAVESTNPYSWVGSTMLLGASLVRAGDVREGASLMAEATEQIVRFRMPMQVWLAVETVANTLVTAGVVYDAAVLWAAVAADGKSPISRTLKDPSLAGIVAGALTADEADVARREGSILTMDAAAIRARTAMEKLATSDPNPV